MSEIIPTAGTIRPSGSHDFDEKEDWRTGMEGLGDRQGSVIHPLLNLDLESRTREGIGANGLSLYN